MRFGLLGLSATKAGLRADRATVQWISEEPAPTGLEDGPAVLLGEADRTLFVYLPKEETTMRIPADTAVVTIDTSVERWGADPGCHPEPKEAG